MGSLEQQAQQWADDRLNNSELYQRHLSVFNRNINAKKKEFDALKRSLLKIYSTVPKFSNATFDSDYKWFINRYNTLRFTDSHDMSSIKYIRHRVLRMALTDDIGDCFQTDFSDPMIIAKSQVVDYYENQYRNVYEHPFFEQYPLFPLIHPLSLRRQSNNESVLLFQTRNKSEYRCLYKIATFSKRGELNEVIYQSASYEQLETTFMKECLQGLHEPTVTYDTGGGEDRFSITPVGLLAFNPHNVWKAKTYRQSKISY